MFLYEELNICANGPIHIPVICVTILMLVIGLQNGINLRFMFSLDPGWPGDCRTVIVSFEQIKQKNNNSEALSI